VAIQKGRTPARQHCTHVAQPRSTLADFRAWIRPLERERRGALWTRTRHAAGDVCLQLDPIYLDLTAGSSKILGGSASISEGPDFKSSDGESVAVTIAL